MKCARCGKPLSDQVSISLGIGPVCRINIKNNGSEEKTGNLFSDRSEYIYQIDFQKKIIAIEDMGGFKSATNDMENILRDIFEDNDKIISSFKIMYCDGYGIWDGVHYEDGQVSFYSINERSYQAAVRKLCPI